MGKNAFSSYTQLVYSAVKDIRYSYLCWSLLNKELSQFQCSSCIFCRIMTKVLVTLDLLPRASKLGVLAGYLFFHTDQHLVFSKLGPFQAK